MELEEVGSEKENGLVRTEVKRRRLIITKTRRNPTQEWEFTVRIGEEEDGRDEGELKVHEVSKRSFLSKEREEAVKKVVSFLSELVFLRSNVELRGEGCKQAFTLEEAPGKFDLGEGDWIVVVSSKDQNLSTDQLDVGTEFGSDLVAPPVPKEPVPNALPNGNGSDRVRPFKYKDEASGKIQKLRAQLEDLRNDRPGGLAEQWGANDWCTTITTIMALIHFYKLQIKGFTTRSADAEAADLMGRGGRQFARYRKRFEELGIVEAPIRGKWKRPSSETNNANAKLEGEQRPPIDSSKAPNAPNEMTI